MSKPPTCPVCHHHLCFDQDTVAANNATYHLDCLVDATTDTHDSVDTPLDDDHDFWAELEEFSELNHPRPLYRHRHTAGAPFYHARVSTSLDAIRHVFHDDIGNKQGGIWLARPRWQASSCAR